MNFQTANEKLNTGRTKNRKKVANNTYLNRLEDNGVEYIALQLHNTNIVMWYSDGRVLLNAGGWRTVTTKSRINEYAEGAGIAQKAGVWYVIKDGDILSKESPKYFDGIDISKL